MQLDNRVGLGVPVRRDLRGAYWGSLVAAVLVTAASVIGLVYRANLYRVENLAGRVSTDVTNLLIIVPVLLAAVVFARRGSLLGLLIWPGALCYLLYVYVAYVIGVPFGALFLVYLGLVPLLTVTLIALVVSIDHAAVGQRLAGAVPARLAGGILIGLGMLFMVRQIAVVIPAVVSGTLPPTAELDIPTSIADFAVVYPVWMVGGWLLWRRKALGLSAGVGLLFLGSMLFVGVVVYLVCEAVITASALDVVSVILMAVMGLVCIVPFGMFVRGVQAR